MTRGKQTTALALAGAVALASGAYALGTQVDDGNAAADSPNAAPAFAGGPGRPGFGHRGGPGPRFDGLADDLGVSEEKLRAALTEIAEEHRTDFAQKLADALKIDRAKVEAAFDKLRPKRPDRPPRAPEAFAAALAKELGLTTAKVRAALAKHRDNPTSPEELANELGVSEQQLHDAFHAVMGKIRPRLHRRPGGDDLAKQLGVTRAQLQAAFDKLRAQREDLRDQFAQELATKLGISVEKVQDAIGDFGPFGRHHP
jgi:biotin operon repressor